MGVYVSGGRCVRVFVGGIRVRDGVTVAVAVGVDVHVGVKLAVSVNVDVTEAVNEGDTVRVGVVVKVCVGSGLLVDVAPPVLGIASSESASPGYRVRWMRMGRLYALMPRTNNTAISA
jgi:hypothetical protein